MSDMTAVQQATARAAGPAASQAAAEHFAASFAGVMAAFLVTALPIALHGVAPAAGIGSAALLSAFLAWRMPQVAILTILVAFAFQNVLVSVMAGLVRDGDDFDIVRGYNFVILATTWLTVIGRYFTDWPRHDAAVMRYLRPSIVLFAGLGVYFLYGYAVNGFTAIVYLRNIVTPFLFFHICLLVLSRHPVRLGLALSVIAWLVVLCGLSEFFYRQAWFDWTNSAAYWDLSGEANYLDLSWDKHAAETGVVTTSVLDTFETVFFNSPVLKQFGGTVLRMSGPNMHPISFSYLLSFLFVFSLFRGAFLRALLAFLLLFLSSAKGPLIVALMTLAGWSAARLIGSRPAFAIFAAGLVAYAGIVIVVGLDFGDYHVLGLMGGIYEFLANPLGYGVGSAGNLSPLFKTLVWTDAQAAGRTPFAVESAIGVLLYQVGPVAFFYIGVCVWIALRLYRIAEATGHDLHIAVAFGVLAVLTNGLFQEEALFSPLSFALFLGLAGMIIGAAIRTGLEREPSRLS